MSREEKALESILSAISDIRVNVQMAGYLLSGEDAEAKERLYQLVDTARSFDNIDNAADEDEVADEEIVDDEAVEEEEVEEAAEWYNKISELEEGKLDDEEITELIAEFVEDETIFGYTDGQEEALCRRVGYVFSDGTIIWYGAGDGIFLSHLKDKLEEKDWLRYKYLIGFSTPTFVPYANGWNLVPNPDWRTITSMVELMESRMDEEAKVFIPMSYFADYKVEFGLSEYLGQLGIDEEDEEDETLPVHLAAFALLTMVREGKLPYKREVIYTDALEFFPEHSSNGKFEKFLDILENEYNWGIVRDECCGTCSGGSARDIRSEEGKENCNIFFTWSQNSFAYWGTSGWVEHVYYATEDKDLKEVVLAADAVRLNVDITHSEYGSGDSQVAKIS